MILLTHHPIARPLVRTPAASPNSSAPRQTRYRAFLAFTFPQPLGPHTGHRSSAQKRIKSELFQGHIGRNTANGNHISVFQTRCTGIRMFLQPKHEKPVGRLLGGRVSPSENPGREVRDLPGRDRVPDRRLSAMCPTCFHVGCRRRERLSGGNGRVPAAPPSYLSSVLPIARPNAAPYCLINSRRRTAIFSGRITVFLGCRMLKT